LIAAVNGVAAGGGFEIALACDVVIAADSARFGLPEPRVGLIAGAGGIHRLTRQIPLKHAMGMLLTGRLVSAAEGMRLGFINEVVPAPTLMATAQRWAEQMLACSPLLLQLTKEAVQDGHGLDVDDAIARDWGQRIPRMLASEDYIEGPLAFSEKRPPVWTGR
jgi:crotonobetainyl-CoA hydratase